VLVIVEMVSPEEEGAGASSLEEEGDGASSRVKKFGCGRRKLKKGRQWCFIMQMLGTRGRIQALSVHA
jgi:hypothetical protein